MGKKGLSRDAVKLIAVFAMTLNHAARAFPMSRLAEMIMTDIGYYTAVTMCFFLVEGFCYTRSYRKYALRLLAFAVIAQWPYMQICGKTANMLFTLLACLCILIVQEQVQQNTQRNVLTMLLVISTVISDWGVLAPLFTLMFYRARGDRQKEKKAYLIAFGAFFIAEYLTFIPEEGALAGALQALCASVPILLSGLTTLYLYNGKRSERGKTFFKWFFYVYYPAHLLVLAFISHIV